LILYLKREIRKDLMHKDRKNGKLIILNTLLILHLAEQNNERFTGILR